MLVLLLILGGMYLQEEVGVGMMQDLVEPICQVSVFFIWPVSLWKINV